MVIMMIIDLLDHHHEHHRDEENIVVVDDIDIAVYVHHLVHVRRLQVHRLIVHVHHQVDHIEDIDVDDHVSRPFFPFSTIKPPFV